MIAMEAKLNRGVDLVSSTDLKQKSTLISNVSSQDWFQDKCESGFDEWVYAMEAQYLPESLKLEETNTSNSLPVNWYRQQWYNKIQCDMKETCRLSALQSIIIGISAILLISMHYISICPPNEVQNNQNDSTTTTNKFENDRNVFECPILAQIVIWDFIMATIYLIILLMYIMHLVELFSDFPWLMIEMIFGFLSMSFLLCSGIVGCLLDLGNTVVLFSILQLIMCCFYFINRFYKYQLDRPAQQFSDEDLEYVRRLKMFFRPTQSFISPKTCTHPKTKPKIKIKSKTPQKHYASSIPNILKQIRQAEQQNDTKHRDIFYN